MIGVDWGTTSVRAYRLDGATVRDRVSAPGGILTVPAGGFPAALRALVGPWLDDGESRVLMAGMVGSRQGWREAPYLPCPAGPADLARGVVDVAFPGARAKIVPGLTDIDAAGVPEVMRGEETQLAGIAGDGLCCLPGSHSKWARVADGRVAGFTTYLSGEAFAAIRAGTILGRTMTDAPPDADAFAQGVSAAEGSLLHRLFGVRTRVLFGTLTEAGSASYLSGLLIGEEIRDAMAAPGATVRLVGAAALCALYARAIELCGGRAVLEDTDAAAVGLAGIGGALAWD